MSVQEVDTFRSGSIMGGESARIDSVAVDSIKKVVRGQQGYFPKIITEFQHEYAKYDSMYSLEYGVNRLGDTTKITVVETWVDSSQRDTTLKNEDYLVVLLTLADLGGDYGKKYIEIDLELFETTFDRFFGKVNMAPKYRISGGFNYKDFLRLRRFVTTDSVKFSANFVISFTYSGDNWSVKYEPILEPKSWKVAGGKGATKDMGDKFYILCDQVGRNRF